MLKLFRRNTPMRLDAIEMTTRKNDDKKDRAKALAITLKMGPFQAEDALCFPGLKPLLFADNSTAPLPRPGLLELTWAHGADGQKLELRAAPDTVPSVTLLDVEVGPKLRIRRDKETPTYEATITVTCEPTKDDQAFITANYTEQLFVTFEEQQPSLIE